MPPRPCRPGYPAPPGQRTGSFPRSTVPSQTVHVGHRGQVCLQGHMQPRLLAALLPWARCILGHGSSPDTAHPWTRLIPGHGSSQTWLSPDMAQPQRSSVGPGAGCAEPLLKALLPGGRGKPGLARDLATLLPLTSGSSAPACRARALWWPRPPRGARDTAWKTRIELAVPAAVGEPVRAPAPQQHRGLGAWALLHPVAACGAPGVLPPQKPHPSLSCCSAQEERKRGRRNHSI